MWALVSPDGVVPSQMVSVSVSPSVIPFCTIKSRSSLQAPAHQGAWSRKKRAVKRLWCVFGGLGRLGSVLGKLLFKSNLSISTITWLNYKYNYINYQVIKLQVLITAALIVIKLQILITTTKSRNTAPIRIIMLNPLVNLIQNCCSATCHSLFV